jgi:hypothetical protein
MAKTSFAKKVATVAPPASAPAPAEKQLAVRPPAGLGSVKHEGRNDMGGQWLPNDSRLPRLNMRQKSSGDELQENFAFGDLVFAKKIKLADAETAINVVAVLAGKDYQQKIPFGEGQGVTYATAEEVLDNGGTLTYTREAVESKIFFGPRAHIQFGIKATAELTEDDLNFFPFEFGGDRWAMSIMTVASSAFTSLGKEIETLRRHNRVMMKGLIFGNLEMSTKLKQKPGQQWYVPQAKLVGENPADLVEFLDSIK